MQAAGGVGGAAAMRLLKPLAAEAADGGLPNDADPSRIRESKSFFFSGTAVLC